MRTTDDTVQMFVKFAFSAGLLWSWQSAHAQDSMSYQVAAVGHSTEMKGKGLSIESTKDDDLWVEIEFPASELVPYSDRRPTNQLSFGSQFEAASFANYLSPIDNQTYETLFKKGTVDIAQIAIGWKLNLPLLGIDVQGVYGNGTVSGRDAAHQLTSLGLSKKGVKVTAILDGIFADNYLVPYFGMQYVQWDVRTSNDLANVTLTTAPAMAMTAGALISLHWLERQAALASYNEGRLSNTYIDLFMNQYQKPSNAADPDLSGTAFGAGFKLEF